MMAEAVPMAMGGRSLRKGFARVSTRNKHVTQLTQRYKRYTIYTSIESMQRMV